MSVKTINCELNLFYLQSTGYSLLILIQNDILQINNKFKQEDVLVRPGNSIIFNQKKYYAFLVIIHLTGMMKLSNHPFLS